MKPLKGTAPLWKRVVLRLVPTHVQEHLRELRGLSGAERQAHLGVTWQRFAGRTTAVPPSLDDGGTVLFVCYGNIIRSALAEAMTRRHSTAAGIRLERVKSAGLAAQPGREADARAVAAGGALGIDLRSHRAQPLTRALVDEASVIYVMDRLNEAQLLARFPDAGPKLRRLGGLAVIDGDDIIADPYVLNADAVAAVAARIDRATRALVVEIARRAGTETREMP